MVQQEWERRRSLLDPTGIPHKPSSFPSFDRLDRLNVSTSAPPQTPQYTMRYLAGAWWSKSAQGHGSGKPNVHATSPLQPRWH